MSEFEFPTNIKQIGSIGEGLRIYIEDYAYSYLQQYVDMPGFETRLALLVGRSMIIDGQDVLFVSGVVKGVETGVERGMQSFTARSFEHARREIDRYFRGLEIIGWMYSQPGFGTGLPAGIEEYHTKAFSNDADVCMVMDGEQKLCAFYIRQGDKLIETKGFFVYYDKNRGMHEYMLDNKVSKIKVVSAQGKGLRGDDVEEASLHKPSGEVAVERIRKNYSKRNNLESRGDRESRPRSRIRPIMLRLTRPISPRRQLGLLATMCLVLFVATIVMGAGLVQNVERIDFLERQMQDLSIAYRGLVASMFGEGETVPVVAPASPVAQPTPEQLHGEAPSESLLQEQTLPEQTLLEQTSQEEQLVVSQAIDWQEALTQEANQSHVNQGPINLEEVISQLQAMDYLPLEYVVAAGDTLSEISRRFYGTTERMAEIMEYNGISDPNDIMIGSTLRLPRR